MNTEKNFWLNRLNEYLIKSSRPNIYLKFRILIDLKNLVDLNLFYNCVRIIVSDCKVIVVVKIHQSQPNEKNTKRIFDYDYNYN